MNHKIARRDFIKAAGAGILITATQGAVPAKASGHQAEPKLSGAAFIPNADYPRRPKRFSEVSVRDRFWQPKIKTNAEVTIPFEIRKSAASGRPIGNNVLEASIYSLQLYPDANLEAQVEARILEIKTAQEARVSNGNGLFEVAAARFASTGKRDLLDLAVKSADLIYNTYASAPFPFSGGERDAINCVQLYRATHEKRYLKLAKLYLDIRGAESSVNRSRHNQSHKPVLEQSEAVGHAVNAASLMVSLVDVGVLTGLGSYFEAAERIWLDAVGTKLYITGGIGSTGNEGFGAPYSLPNLSAYCESCAAFMFVTFNHKMFLATGDGKYIDVMERTMYNNAVDGVSASGDRFFYVNRLASAGDGRDLRWEKASLECCPPNLVRFLASMPGYIYAQGQEGIYVNLYVSSATSFDVGGKRMTLSMESEMPWGGRSNISVSTRGESAANIKLRIPGWAGNRPVPGGLYSNMDRLEARPVISVNGRKVACPVDRSGYANLDRNWKDGDIVEVIFPFEVRKVVAHPKVREHRGRMAVERGPIVFCAEGHDCEGGRALELLMDPKDELIASFERGFFGGVTVIDGKARDISRPQSEKKPVKLIPYHLWANRGAAEMNVWVSKAEYEPGDTGPAGGLIFFVNPNYAADGWRYLEAAPFDQSEGAKWGCFRTLIPGARGAEVGAGRQNTRDIIAACATPGSAAELCVHFELNGIRGWFLPSTEELKQMYVHLKLAGLGDFAVGGAPDNVCYWSSTQRTADMADHLDFADNGLRQHYDDKDYHRRVRAIRAF